MSSVAEAENGPRHLVLDGTHKRRLDKGRSRIVIAMLVFLCVYGVIAGRLVQLALYPEQRIARPSNNDSPAVVRPDIVDRNGVILATDVRQPSLFAEPRRIIDPDEAAELLAETLPGLNPRELRVKLASGRGFVWLKRRAAVGRSACSARSPRPSAPPSTGSASPASASWRRTGASTRTGARPRISSAT